MALHRLFTCLAIPLLDLLLVLVLKGTCRYRTNIIILDACRHAFSCIMG